MRILSGGDVKEFERNVLKIKYKGKNR